MRAPEAHCRRAVSATGESRRRGMRVSRLRVVGTVAAAFAIAAMSAQSAFAAHEPPEWGRCVKVEAGKTGAYTGPTCLKLATNLPGKYEWVAASITEKLAFSGAGLETILTSVGHPTVKCIAANLSGEYT